MGPQSHYLVTIIMGTLTWWYHWSADVGDILPSFRGTPTLEGVDELGVSGNLADSEQKELVRDGNELSRVGAGNSQKTNAR